VITSQIRDIIREGRRRAEEKKDSCLIWDSGVK
jgi:hypothetical protein